MAANRVIQRFLTVALLLVFTQKMGMGLYLHNWLHSTKIHATSTPLTSEELKNACSCLNDFTAPLAETSIQNIPTPPQVTFIHNATVVGELPVVHKYFRSLRAPPAPLI